MTRTQRIQARNDRMFAMFERAKQQGHSTFRPPVTVLCRLRPCIGDEWAAAVVYGHDDWASHSVFIIFPAANFVFMGSRP